MNITELIQQRLFRQQLLAPKFTHPAQVVSWMGAMQAQEYALSKWAIATRLPYERSGVPLYGNDAMEQLFNDGSIIRTHVLRPTWHFVSPADIRWMLQLTAPRVHAINSFIYRQCSLDEAVFKRSDKIIARALEGQQLTRDQLKAILEKKQIKTETVSLACLLMHAELEGIICSGARKGKQFTYALMDERIPAVKPLTRAEALAELTARYFASRGPAMAADFAYWSSLTVKDVKEGIAMLGKQLHKEVIEGKEYYFAVEHKAASNVDTLPGLQSERCTMLMADYDEYVMSYKDRSALVYKKETPSGLQHIVNQGQGSELVFNRLILIDGRASGTWKRTLMKDKVQIELVPFGKINKLSRQKLITASNTFGAFLGLKAEISFAG